MAAITIRSIMRAMATSNSIVCSRIGLLLLSVAALIWSILMVPSFWASAPAKDISAQILAGDRFKLERTSDMLAVMQASCKSMLERSDLARAGALTWMRIAEEGLGRRDSDELGRNLEVAEDQLRCALTLNPVDSILWLKLYSLEISRNGFHEKTVRFLTQSYVTGPREGWIALQRNGTALAGFSAMNVALPDEVISEFSAMVDSHLDEAAANNLTGIGWEQRERLLAGLSSADPAARETFAKRLARDGVRITVPGVELNERFWR